MAAPAHPAHRQVVVSAVDARDVTLAEQDFAAMSGAVGGEHGIILDLAGRDDEWQ
jgi:hypothetical protein